jgi:hypothetical protein
MDEYSEATLQNRALDVALEEWDTIRHALEQRENPRYKKALVELDKLAFECLSPLFGKDKLGNIYSYIHKLFDIKRFAFSRTPLIGAPFEALNAPESWLAIPHETGHYTFWNGTSTFDTFNNFYVELQDSILGTINNALKKRITGGYFRRRGQVFQIWLNWMSEIFADVFGTLVAGPAYAWSIQSRLHTHLNVRDLYHSHEEPTHPDPFIRPYFHIITLRKMAEADKGDFAAILHNESNRLEKSWEDSWLAIDNSILDKIPTPDNIGTMEEVLNNEVPNVVKKILNVNLGDNLPNSLLEYYNAGSLYTLEKHSRINQIADDVVNGGKVEVDSPLVRCAAAQMAIINGAEPIQVHLSLGFEGTEEMLKDNKELNAMFEEFLENVTGKSKLEEQRKSWRRVLNYSLNEQDFHWHTHNHYH